jgi:hypothetical protein
VTSSTLFAATGRSTTSLFIISFLGKTLDLFSFFPLSLRIYLWLTETSQQPISQLTWLKVKPLFIFNHDWKNSEETQVF